MLKIWGRLSSIACEFERWYRGLLAHPASRGVLQLPPA